MAITIIKNTKSFDKGFILTPERYNPNRKLRNTTSDDCISLSEIVISVNDIISPKQANKSNNKIIVVNTGDAYEGHIKLSENKEQQWSSNKKVVKPGDVIISRLRPYLRQIAYIDSEIYDNDKNSICAVSTEFYVLRGKGNHSIGFLVPLLLSDRVQAVFANAVEGSQHPRFKEDVLLDIAIPKTLFHLADELSLSVTENVLSIRKYEKAMNGNINIINKYIS